MTRRYGETIIKKLNRMIDYCETQQCLRQFILSYFGDNSPCTCDKCSNCVVVEDEEEENYIQTKKEKEKKRSSLPNLTPKGQELFEQLRKCRTELAAEKGVPPYIICSDKTLTDMCAKCPADNEDMETVYGMVLQKIQSYGEHFTKIIIDFFRRTECSRWSRCRNSAINNRVNTRANRGNNRNNSSSLSCKRKETAILYRTGKIRRSGTDRYLYDFRTYEPD